MRARRTVRARGDGKQASLSSGPHLVREREELLSVLLAVQRLPSYCGVRRSWQRLTGPLVGQAGLSFALGLQGFCRKSLDRLNTLKHVIERSCRGSTIEECRFLRKSLGFTKCTLLRAGRTDKTDALCPAVSPFYYLDSQSVVTIEPLKCRGSLCEVP